MEKDSEWRPNPQALAEFGELVRLLRQDAKRAGRDKVKTTEIVAEVVATRKRSGK
jgi:hypothetical protein